jgi:hypothetical protein
MQIQRAVRLGPLHGRLGIKPDACIFFELKQTGVMGWDLQTGTRRTVDQNGPTVTKDRFQVPLRIKEILSAKD